MGMTHGLKKPGPQPCFLREDHSIQQALQIYDLGKPATAAGSDSLLGGEREGWNPKV